MVSGSVRLSVANASGRFSVDQTLTAPQVLAPDYLFGRSPRYPGSIVAIDRVGIMQIAKEDYRQMLSSDPVFLFNFLNTVSTNAQKGLHGILAVATGSLEERIAFWIISMTQPGSTDIVLRCQHRDLYALFGVSRHSLLHHAGFHESRRNHRLRLFPRDPHTLPTRTAADTPAINFSGPSRSHFSSLPHPSTYLSVTALDTNTQPVPPAPKPRRRKNCRVP